METFVRSKLHKKCSITFKMFFSSVPINNTLTNYRLLNKFRKTGFLMNKKGYRNPPVFQKEFCVLLERDYRHLHDNFNPYPTAFPYGNGMVLHFYQQQESSTTKTVHKVINKGLKAYVRV